MQSHQDNIKALISRHQRRLQGLKEKQAQYGLETPVSILTEIEDIESEIEELQGNLEQPEQSEGFTSSKAISINKKPKSVHWWVWGLVLAFIMLTIITLAVMLIFKSNDKPNDLDASSTPIKYTFASPTAIAMIPPSPTLLFINTPTAIPALPSPLISIIPLATPVIDPTPTQDIPPLKNPSFLEEKDGDLKFLCRESTQEEPLDNTQNPDGFTVTTIYQGETENPSNLVFDILLSNNSNTTKSLVNLKTRWCYSQGTGAASTDRGYDILTPIADWIIKIPIDPEDISIRNSNTAIVGTLQLYPKSEIGPNKKLVRLQLYYYFDEQARIKYHPNAGWDIYFDLYIETDSNESVKVFRGQSWKELSRVLSEKPTNTEINTEIPGN